MFHYCLYSCPSTLSFKEALRAVSASPPGTHRETTAAWTGSSSSSPGVRLVLPSAESASVWAYMWTYMWILMMLDLSKRTSGPLTASLNLLSNRLPSYHMKAIGKETDMSQILRNADNFKSLHSSMLYCDNLNSKRGTVKAFFPFLSCIAIYGKRNVVRIFLTR